MELEDWRYDLQAQLEELAEGKRDPFISVPIGHPPTEEDIREAGEIIREAGRAVLELKAERYGITVEVA